MSASLAFVFPGQGSQSLGMLAELGAQYPLILETFKEASDALGYDLWALTQEGPEELLNQTDKTQPAILTASIALWRLWLAEGGARPAFVAGHSLGEYSALVAAGSLTLGEAVKLVERRGQLMQEAVLRGRVAWRRFSAWKMPMCWPLVPKPRKVKWSARSTSTPGPGGDRRCQGRCRARHRGLQGAWRQARHAIAGQRAIALRADASGRRALC